MAVKLRKKLEELIEKNEAFGNIDKLFEAKELNIEIIKSKSELIVVTLATDFILNNLIVSNLLMWEEIKITMCQK